MQRTLSLVLFTAGLLAGLPSLARGQDPQSAAPARELAQLLSDRKLDSFAARMPGTPDEFVATLAFPGQMIVVWARFSAPAVLNEKLLRREFREAYIDLNSASIAESRNIITDLFADGVRRGGKNQPSDSHDVGSKSMRFDGSWREDKMSEQEYVKAHEAADAAYARALGVLLEEIRKGS